MALNAGELSFFLGAREERQQQDKGEEAKAALGPHIAAVVPRSVQWSSMVANIFSLIPYIHAYARP